MIDLKTIFKLAAKPHTVEASRSVVFTGKMALVMVGTGWIVGVPCEQTALTAPVVVPIGAIQRHMAKSRHLVVTPEGLTNGSNITTPFGKAGPEEKGTWYECMLDLLPKMPTSTPVTFDLDLDALDRVLVATAQKDIRHYLNGVLFDLTHGALVGTDGHRLHVYLNRVPMAFDRAVVDGVPTKPVVQVICPNDPLDFIVRSSSEAVQVSMWDADKEQQGCMVFNAGDAFVWVRQPVLGKFPDWQRVLPAVAQRPVWVELDPVRLADAAAALATVQDVAGVKAPIAQLHLGAQALIAWTRDSMPLAMKLHSDCVETDLAKAARGLFASFHPGYLQDVADCVTAGAQWRLHLNPCNESLLVVEGDFRGVVMPTRCADDLSAPVDKPRKPKKAAPVAQDAPQTAPVAAEAAQAPETPQGADSEPVPAAVAAVVAQLVKGARETAKKAPRKPKKAAPVAA